MVRWNEPGAPAWMRNHDVVVPEGTTLLDEQAFSGCKGLTTVTIPNSVTQIGDYAFCECEGLTTVTIPNSVTQIGENAFRDCTGLTTVTIPNSVTHIDDFAFKKCRSLSVAVLPEELIAFSGNWFDDCPLLKKGPIPWSDEAMEQVLKFRYWSPNSHALCNTTRREWVTTLFLCFSRECHEARIVPPIPVEMIVMILGMLLLSDLGPCQ